MAHVAKAMPAAHLLVQACQHVWLVLDDGACANVHICWSYPSIPSASPHSCSQVRPCLTARLTGYPGGYIVPRASHRAVASSACPGRERLMEQPVSSSHFFLLKQRFMRLLVARYASSQAATAARLAPGGLPAPSRRSPGRWPSPLGYEALAGLSGVVSENGKLSTLSSNFAQVLVQRFAADAKFTGQLFWPLLGAIEGRRCLVGLVDRLGTKRRLVTVEGRFLTLGGQRTPARC
jgi:hypothetical protein